MLNRDQDYLEDCNPDKKYRVDEFTAVVCAQCSRPQCVRSSYRQTATDKKLERAEELTRFVDPETVPESPLSEYPEEVREDGAVVHRAVVPETAEDSKPLDEAALELARHQALPEDHSVASPPPAPESTSPPPKQDPWEVPHDFRHNIYKEFDDPKDDPWSADFEGPRRIHAEPGATITLTGRRKK